VSDEGWAPQGHGGQHIATTLKHLGVSHLFTLTGGHIFPIFDGCHKEGIRLVDTRHEQTAVFAAEGWARLKRELGVAAVTAGPGVTNAMSALAQASFNRAPVLALGGRAPAFRWGQGSLQEMDHPPFVDPIAPAKTVPSTDEISRYVLDAALEALGAPSGPRFLDFPLDVLFNVVDGGAELDPIDLGDGALSSEASAEIEKVVSFLETAERPIIVAGSNVWLDRGDDALRRLVARAHIPVYMNGQGRGCLPADDPLAFARSRSKGMKEADLVIVAGTPMDFRLGFGQGFASDAKVVHIDPGGPPAHVDLAAAVTSTTKLAFEALAEGVEQNGSRTKAWVEALREFETQKKESVAAELNNDSNPIHPMRIYGELAGVLERDAIVIGDGGDFVSYAGREVPSYEPGCWLDPGPFGCLGVGPGYAMAARLAHPDKQVAIMYGDGALGFGGMDLESLVRLKLPVVCIVGNNGIWGLEKHPMRALYGYDLVADLRPGTRYDQMMEALGGKGELVTEPVDIGPALQRAFASGEPTLVNILTDPDIAYPRSSNLA
jgi:acetolactate synthase-1/2/3 large subunit